MWTGNKGFYGKEPFDLRLTILRMVRQLPVIIAVTLLGMLVLGGGYYLKNVVLNDECVYTARSVYKVNYVKEGDSSWVYYINNMTWDTYVHSEEFMDMLWAQLEQDAVPLDVNGVYTREEVADSILLEMESDVFVPTATITTESPEWTMLIAAALEKVMVGPFAEKNEQIVDIRVIDPAVEAEEVLPDVRPMRALVLSGIVSLLFVVAYIGIKETLNDAVWLPATLRSRYGLPVVGTEHSPELGEHLEFLLKDCTDVAVCTVSEDINPEEVSAALPITKQWTAVPTPVLCPEAAKALRNADGVLLVVPAGKGAGKSAEYVLEYLTTQQIAVNAVLLWDADEWLIKTYYRLSLGQGKV